MPANDRKCFDSLFCYQVVKYLYRSLAILRLPKNIVDFAKSIEDDIFTVSGSIPGFTSNYIESIGVDQDASQAIENLAATTQPSAEDLAKAYEVLFSVKLEKARELAKAAFDEQTARRICNDLLIVQSQIREHIQQRSEEDAARAMVDEIFD